MACLKKISDQNEMQLRQISCIAAYGWMKLSNIDWNFKHKHQNKSLTFSSLSIPVFSHSILLYFQGKSFALSCGRKSEELNCYTARQVCEDVVFRNQSWEKLVSNFLPWFRQTMCTARTSFRSFNILWENDWCISL